MKKDNLLQSQERVLLCAAHALDKKALDVKIIKVQGISSLTDYLLIASGTSDRHVQAVAEEIRVKLKSEHDLRPLAVEGMDNGRWVLIDYGDVMVHVFQPEVRSFYDLEGLWSEAPRLPIPAELQWEEVSGPA
jgi:ribosome-associated protein